MGDREKSEKKNIHIAVSVLSSSRACSPPNACIAPIIALKIMFTFCHFWLLLGFRFFFHHYLISAVAYTTTCVNMLFFFLLSPSKVSWLAKWCNLGAITRGEGEEEPEVCLSGFSWAPLSIRLIVALARNKISR